MVLLNTKKEKKNVLPLMCRSHIKIQCCKGSCTCCKGVDIIDINKWCSCQSYLLVSFIMWTKILVLTGTRNGQLWSVLFCSLTRQHVVCLGFRSMSPSTMTCLDFCWEVQNELESRGGLLSIIFTVCCRLNIPFLWWGPEDKMFFESGNC